MSGILVVAEHSGGAFLPTAAELLGKATELAQTLGTTVSAAVLGEAPAAELGGKGPMQVAGEVPRQASSDQSMVSAEEVGDAPKA